MVSPVNITTMKIRRGIMDLMVTTEVTANAINHPARAEAGERRETQEA